MAFAKRQYPSSRPFDATLTLFGSIRPIVVRRFFDLSLLVFLACFSVFGAAAADESGSTSGRPDSGSFEVVTFALPDVWPWAYEDEVGTARGSLVEVVQRLSELTGIPVETRVRPLRRGLIELESGAVNFSIVFQSPVLDTQAISIARVVEVDIMLAAMADTCYPLTLEALGSSNGPEGRGVGFIRGSYPGEAFAQNTEVEKVPVAVISQAVEMLSLGRLSAIMASDYVILRTLQTMDLGTDVLRYSKHIADQAGVLYMSRKAQRPHAAEKFRMAISRMVESNELNQIFFGEAGRPLHADSGRPVMHSTP